MARTSEQITEEENMVAEHGNTIGVAAALVAAERLGEYTARLQTDPLDYRAIESRAFGDLQLVRRYLSETDDRRLGPSGLSDASLSDGWETISELARDGSGVEDRVGTFRVFASAWIYLRILSEVRPSET
jgi:hypothetical protein